MKISRRQENLTLLIASLFSFSVFFAGFVHILSVNARATGPNGAEYVGTSQVERASATDQSKDNDNSHFITIFDGDEKIIVKSDAETVREVLERAEITLDRADRVEPALDEKIADDEFYINIYRSREIIMLDGGVKKFVRTAASDPVAIAEDAGFELRDEDEFEIVPYDGLLESGHTTAYKIKRAKQVNLNFYGKSIVKYTQAKTVIDFLKEQDIDFAKEKVWISLPAGHEITNNMNLDVIAQGKQTITVDEEIAFEEQVNYDFSLPYGKEEITQVGQPGKKTVTYEIEMKDGVELSREFISEIITAAPVTQQRTIGRKTVLPPGSHEDWMRAAGIAESDFGYVNYIIQRESSWNPNALNPHSGACSLAQALPCSKVGPDWRNPVTALKWADSYAVGRYGSWEAAYQFWISHNWW